MYANKEQLRDYKLRWQTQRRRDARVWLGQVKTQRQCMDCLPGTVWPAEALDFDHVRGEKLFSLSDAVGQCRSRQRLEDEIAKCEVVCSNHHRMRTVARHGAA